MTKKEKSKEEAPMQKDEETVEESTEPEEQSGMLKEKAQKSTTKSKPYKCPNCGATLKSFNSSCPYCDSELREIKASTSLEEFSKGLQKIKSRPFPKFEEKESLLKKAIGSDFKSNDAKSEFKRECESQRDDEIASYINNYPIPNSKEDLTEFMILVTANIDLNTESDDVVQKAWLLKMDQIMTKAKLSIKNSEDLSVITQIYDEKREI